MFSYWEGMGLLLFGVLIGMALGYKLYRNALIDQISYFMMFEKEHRELKFKETYEHFLLLTWIDRLRMKLNGYEFDNKR